MFLLFYFLTWFSFIVPTQSIINRPYHDVEVVHDFKPVTTMEAAIFNRKGDNSSVEKPIFLKMFLRELFYNLKSLVTLTKSTNAECFLIPKPLSLKLRTDTTYWSQPDGHGVKKA